MTHPNTAQLRAPHHRDLLQSPWRPELVRGHVDEQFPLRVIGGDGAAVQRHLDKVFVVTQEEGVVTLRQLHRLLKETTCRRKKAQITSGDWILL